MVNADNEALVADRPCYRHALRFHGIVNTGVHQSSFFPVGKLDVGDLFGGLHHANRARAENRQRINAYRTVQGCHYRATEERAPVVRDRGLNPQT